MHYVISDVHGCYGLYLRLLEKIAFSDADTLIFLGDAADRGLQGIEVMRDLMARPNVICLLGNHEDMFRRVARCLGKKLTIEERLALGRTFRNWTQRNGGGVTWSAYTKLPRAEQREILNWMDNLSWYYEITLNGQAFLLAHAGVGEWVPEKDPADCIEHDFIWVRMDYTKTYYKNKLLVTGHTPTFFIDPASAGRILRRNNHVVVDCGAVYEGVLGCLCLETMEEFYVSEQGRD